MRTAPSSIEAQRRKEAARALLNIALLEGVLLFLVAAVYLYTKELIHLAGGVVATSLIFAPVMLRWARDHAPSMKGAALVAEEEE